MGKFSANKHTVQQTLPAKFTESFCECQLMNRVLRFSLVFSCYKQHELSGFAASLSNFVTPLTVATHRNVFLNHPKRENLHESQLKEQDLLFWIQASNLLHAKCHAQKALVFNKVESTTTLLLLSLKECWLSDLKKLLKCEELETWTLLKLDIMRTKFEQIILKRSSGLIYAATCISSLHERPILRSSQNVFSFINKRDPCYV